MEHKSSQKMLTACSTPIIFQQSQKMALSPTPGQKMTAFLQHKRSAQAQQYIQSQLNENPSFHQVLLDKVQKSLQKSASRPEVRKKSVTQIEIELTKLRNIQQQHLSNTEINQIHVSELKQRRKTAHSALQGKRKGQEYYEKHIQFQIQNMNKAQMEQKKSESFIRMCDNSQLSRKQLVEKHMAKLTGKEWQPATVDFTKQETLKKQFTKSNINIQHYCQLDSPLPQNPLTPPTRQTTRSMIKLNRQTTRNLKPFQHLTVVEEQHHNATFQNTGQNTPCTSQQKDVITPVKNKRTVSNQKDEFKQLCSKISQRVPEQWFMRIATGSKNQQFSRATRLKKQAFKDFLSIRYGKQISEKWVNMFDFNQAVNTDYSRYCQQVLEQILTKKETLLQLAFDFYDCNNDQQLSDLDLFKQIQYYGGKNTQLYEKAIQKDCLVLLQLVAHYKQKPQTSEISRFKNFRHQVSRDPNFMLSKQKVMMPIYDKTQPNCIMKVVQTTKNENKSTWLTDIIQKESTLQAYQDGELAQKEYQPESDSGSDNGYFAGNFYHEQKIKHLNKSAKAINKPEKIDYQEEFYQRNRPADRLQKMSSKTRNKSDLYQLLMRGQTKSAQIDRYINSYVENIQKEDNFQLSIEKFKQIAWPSGVPEIVIDLCQYLVGAEEELIASTLKKLCDRVKPTIFCKNGDIISQINKQPVVSKTPQDHEENRRRRKDRKEGKQRLVPPLRDHPLDQYETSDTDSETKEKLESQQFTFLEQTNNVLEYENRRFFEQFFRQLAFHPPKYAQRLEQQNKKSYLVEDRELAKVQEMYMTEETISTGLAKMAGSKCDIFAKLIYLKCAKNQDYIRCNIIDLFNCFSGLLAENSDRRLRVIFGLLDLKGQNHINPLTLVQVYQQLPDRTLFKYEILLLLRSYKVYLSKPHTKKQIDFVFFQSILPQPSLVAFFQKKAFNLLIPNRADKPVFNPFQVYDTNEQFKQAITQLENHNRRQLPQQQIQLCADYMLNPNQYQNLFQANPDFKNASYFLQKLA